MLLSKASRVSEIVIVLSLVCGSLILSDATAANFYFDANGALAGSGVKNGGTYSWEGATWNNNGGAGNVATIDYVDGSFPTFAAGTDATGSYTVTMNANHTCVGMHLKDGSVGSTLTINGTGTLGIDGGIAQGFLVRGGSNVKILNPIGGSGGVSFETVGGTGIGSLFLYGNNSYQGGTVLNTAGGLYFNNNNSFGTGPISWNVASQVIADPDATAPITLANTMTTRATSTLIYVGPAAAPVEFTNAWTLASGTSTLSIGNGTFPSSMMTISGPIGGSGGIEKVGSGTMTLSGSNTYGGATTVSVGTLLANNTAGSATGTGMVTIASGATLGGTGNVGGAVTNNGILTPGVAGVGTLSVGGGITDGANSSWSITLTGASANTLAVTGNIDLSAVDNLNVTGAGSGTSWLIGTYTGTENGAFDTITPGYTISYTGGNITLNAVPSCAPGDFNCDGHVDAADYVALRKNPNIFDFTGRGYDVWRSHFGQTIGSGASAIANAAVPEPATSRPISFLKSNLGRG